MMQGDVFNRDNRLVNGDLEDKTSGIVYSCAGPRLEPGDDPFRPLAAGVKHGGDRAKKQVYIAVVGGSRCTEKEAGLAREAGREIARRKGILVCGGGGGVMEASSAGASSEGGVVIGILPGNEHSDGNRHLSFAVATGLGEARNAVITRTADAVIAVGGEYGTLSEIALALKMGKPVVGLDSWLLDAPHPAGQGMIRAGSAREAVDIAYREIKAV